MKKLFSFILILGIFFSFFIINVHASLSQNKIDKINLIVDKYIIKLSKWKTNSKVINYLDKVVKKIKIVKIKKAKYKEVLEVLEDAIINKINQRWLTILWEYYKKLSNYEWMYKQDLKWAYDMKYNPKFSFEKFEQIYETNQYNVYEIKNIKFLWNNNFKIRVDFYSWSVWKWVSFSQSYEVLMKIISDNKIETIKVQTIKSEVLEEKNYWNNNVILKWEDWIEVLYLNWKKIDETKKIENNYFWFEKHISEIGFIWNWKILKYTFSGYEYRTTIFYNIINWKKIDIWSGIDIYWVIWNNLYVCWESWMVWGKVAIYNLVNFNLIKDLSEWKWIYSCKWFDKENNILNYELIDNNWKNFKKWYKIN